MVKKITNSPGVPPFLLSNRLVVGICLEVRHAKKRVIVKKGAINKIICFHSKTVLLVKTKV